MGVIQVGPTLLTNLWPLLDLSFSGDKIKQALLSINDNKSPRSGKNNIKYFFQSMYQKIGELILISIGFTKEFSH